MSADRNNQDRPDATAQDDDYVALQSAIDLTRDWLDPVQIKLAQQIQKQVEREYRRQAASAVAWQRKPFLARAFRRWRPDPGDLRHRRLPEDCATLLSLRQTGENTVEADGVLDVPRDWPAVRLRLAHSEGGFAELTVERTESRSFPSQHPVHIYFSIKDEFANVRDWYLEIADAHLPEWRKVMHWKLWHRDADLKSAPPTGERRRKVEVQETLPQIERTLATALDLAAIKELPPQRAALVEIFNVASVDPSDFEALLEACGDNFGNEITKGACSDVLSEEPLPAFPLLADGAASAAADHDILVIPASNFISAASDMGPFATYLERTDLPVLIMGLGAQASKEAMATGEKIPLLPGTLRFLKIISERCASIGVRGEFTADQLRLHGIQNVTIIGCPSFYAKPGSLLRAFKPELPPVSRDEFRFQFSSTPSMLKDASRREALLRFHRDAWDQGGDFVIQNEIEMLRGRRPGPANLADRLVVARWFGCTRAEEVRELLTSRCYASADVDAWRKKSGGYHFSIGPRFHGNMIALQAGVPALLLNHDSRTDELGRALNLPMADMTSLRHGVNVYNAYLETRSQNGFEVACREKIAAFLDFLKLNKMRPSPTWIASLEEAFGSR